jgi:hypothetical protein
VAEPVEPVGAGAGFSGGRPAGEQEARVRRNERRSRDLMGLEE